MLDQQKQRNQKSKISDAVHNESFFSRRGRRIFREPESNQQIRRQPHALPPDEHLQVVARQHQRQHEKHEQVQIAEVPVIARIVVHVANGVNVNQKSHAGDHQQHHQRKLIKIKPEISREAPRSYPVSEPFLIRKR